MEIITWNTGRLYTERGQRIAATKLADGRIVMVDVDRGIDYVTTADNLPLERNAVQRAYDYNECFGCTYGERDAVLACTAAALAT